MARTLTDRNEIRQWAEARGGNPMLMDTPDGTGMRTLLQLTFGQHAINTDGNEGPDRIGGFLDDGFPRLDFGLYKLEGRLGPHGHFGFPHLGCVLRGIERPDGRRERSGSTNSP